MSEPEPPTSSERALRATVYSDGEYRPFGELAAGEVARRGAELAEAAGFGHGGRVAGVAAGWKELARVMERSGAERVADLDADTVERFSQRLWVVPPGGSLL